MKYALVIFLSVVGCAGPQPENTGGNGGGAGAGGSSGSGGGSGGSGGQSIDAPVADAMTDAFMKKGFGEPCNDRSECMSNICVFSGLGGTCTQVCPNIGCPNGYGCYGVLGAIDPGVVSNICVPENNLLCTPCSRNTECGSPTGTDMCLPYPTGSFCGRDCSTIACPPTYTCMDMAGTDGGTIKQCVPNNNACDCTPANAGNMVNCTITTPLGTQCAGHRICNGAQGWSNCQPPSTTDLPDDNFTDDNCDGIDGDAANAIFVDVLTGNDNFPGTRTQPVVSMTRAMTLAGSTKQILVSKGDYPPLTLVGGAHIYGGYDAANNWQRSASNIVRIIGANPAVDANNITQETRLELITVVGSDATGIGQSSYGVRVTNSSGPVILHALTVHAGVGTDGGNGGDGSSGSSGVKGGTGGPGCENCGPAGGGPPGASSCHSGGQGGQGTSGSGQAQAGSPGSGTSPGGPGVGGLGCDKDASLCLTTCSCGARTGPTPGGTGGAGQSGTNGGAAAQIGTVSGNTFVPASGNDGSNGADGSSGGGGGGGAGSNCPCFCNCYTGGGGGGGGGAGCHGTRGTKGTGGGGSFAVFVVGSTVAVESSTLVTSNGGNGGNGGSGGVAGIGGQGGDPGAGSSDGEQGAQGGAGGPGGSGGSGSGGSGGPSYGIYSKSSTVMNSGNTFQPGSGGGAGLGGSNGALGAASNGSVGQSGSIRLEP